jgi:hypothetical protein
VRPHLGHELRAVLIWEPEIEDHARGPETSKRSSRAFGGGAEVRLEASGDEALNDETGHSGVVLDDQHAPARAHGPMLPRGASAGNAAFPPSPEALQTRLLSVGA